MKIVLCCRVYSTHNRVGGMLHVVVERAEALARAGHEIHVLTTARMDGPRQTDFEIRNVCIHEPDLGQPQMYSEQYARMCEKWCELLKPDIIHLDSYDKHRLWWHQFKSKCRVVVTNHGEAIGSQLTDWRLGIHGRQGGKSYFTTDEWLEEKRALSGADVVIATCRFDRWMLKDLLGLANVRMVYNPVAPYHFEDRTPVLNNKLGPFLCVGVWGQDERGFDVAKAACDKVGAELKVPQGLSRKQLVFEYDRCQALLLPGFQSKGYDLSVAEAIARQRPVIIADNGVGTMEEIGRNWIRTCPAGDVEYLAALLTVAFDPVPPTAADCHRPEAHISNWMSAVLS